MSRQPNPQSTSYWIEQLGLARHPEGGWFEMAGGEELIALFPQHEALIRRMTRG